MAQANVQLGVARRLGATVQGSGWPRFRRVSQRCCVLRSRVGRGFTTRGVGGGCEADLIFEVANEVGLVVVAELLSERSPVYFVARSDALGGLLHA